VTRRLVIVAHEVGAWVHHRAATAEVATAAGWQVTLVMGGQGDPVPLADGDVPAHQSLPMARGRSGPGDIVASVLMLRRVMGNADVVELVTLKPIVFAMVAWRTLPRRRRPRVVATFAGLGTVLDAAVSKRRKQWNWFVVMLRLLLRGHATVLVENPDDAASLIDAGIVRRADVTVGPGVGLPAAWLALPVNPPLADTAAVRALYVGRLIASKGVVDLADAAQILQLRGAAVEVVMVGSLDDRNPSAVSAAEIEGWIKQGLVQWHGHVTDMLSEYRAAHMVVLPSHREGRPRSLMEAQALGIPVVATDVPGCRQVLDPDVTGVLVPAHDPGALADAIEAMATDHARRGQMGSAARQYAHERFGTQAFLDVWATTVLGIQPSADLTKLPSTLPSRHEHRS